MNTSESKIAAEIAAQASSLVLASQISLIGNLISALAKSKAISLEDAAAVLTNTAEQISSPASRSVSELHDILVAPLRDHCDQLRKLAEKLTTL
jgi:hypothetical protein